jgi:hypothetical protein
MTMLPCLSGPGVRGSSGPEQLSAPRPRPRRASPHHPFDFRLIPAGVRKKVSVQVNHYLII